MAQENQTDRNIAATLFSTIQEICATDKVISNIKDYPWYRFVKQLQAADPAHEFIRLPAGQTADGLVLAVRKPQLEECPAPPEVFKPYLPANYAQYTAKLDADALLAGTGVVTPPDELAVVEELAAEQVADLAAAAEAMADAADGAERVTVKNGVVGTEGVVRSRAAEAAKAAIAAGAAAPEGEAGEDTATGDATDAGASEPPLTPAQQAAAKARKAAEKNAQLDEALETSAGAGVEGLRSVAGTTLAERVQDAREQVETVQTTAKQVAQSLTGKALPPLTGKQRAAAEKWLAQREAWAERQRGLKVIGDLFAGLLKIYNMLKQNANNFELLYAAGMLRVNGSSNFAHPLLTKRLDIRFSDLKNNVLGLFDTEEPLKFEAAALTNLTQASVDNKDQFLEAVNLTDASIYDEADITEFLRQHVHALSVHADFFEEDAHFYGDSKLVVKHQPLLILRERLSGLRAFTSQIIDYINGEKGPIPRHIPSVVSGALPFDASERLHAPAAEDPLGRELASVGGEHRDILLTKPANKEQLSIVEEINASPAIVVQGPPGTGKTHTIANLIGHFLAEGKTLLITSEKDKALTVLQDKLDPDIRALCVPLLGNDRNKALTYSVNSILEKLSTPGLMDQLHGQMEGYRKERQALFDRLLQARKEVYQLRLRLNRGVEYQGALFPLAEIAEFVTAHAADARHIPGVIGTQDALPLSESDLRYLYSTNEEITPTVAADLSLPLPALAELVTPEALDAYVQQQDTLAGGVTGLDEKYGHHYAVDWERHALTCDDAPLVTAPEPAALRAFTDYVSGLRVPGGWRQKVVTAGLAGGMAASQWQLLVNNIEKLAALVSQQQHVLLTHEVTFLPGCDVNKVQSLLPAMTDNVRDGSTGFGFMFRMLHSGVDDVLAKVKVNGHTIDNLADCEAVAAALQVTALQQQTQVNYASLLGREADAPFAEIDYKNLLPATQLADEVKALLAWQDRVYGQALQLAQEAGFSASQLKKPAQLHGDAEKLLAYLQEELTDYAKVATGVAGGLQTGKMVAAALGKLQAPALRYNVLSQQLRRGLELLHLPTYEKAYRQYEAELQHRPIAEKRQELLARLAEKAPGWATQIACHIGEHATTEPPFDMALAWKARQLELLLDEANATPLPQREAQVQALSKALKAKTTQLVSTLSWIHLLDRLEGDNSAVTNLRSWLSLRKRIGKGTGRYAAQYRRQAMGCMVEGRKAVPAWIAPVKTVFETFDPVQNHFDIAIFDEASQSSLEAIAVAFLADKVIVVGDDKQVSPMLVGRDDVVVNEILKANLANLTRRWSMFDGKTSFYELLGSVYPTVMLREHFRCVPEIIGYSNEQFYEGRIIPLRDGNHNTLVPAVVNYHLDAQRAEKGKLNVAEQEACVALLLAMCEQPEYEGRTFGVISLLGDAQATAIERLVNEKVNSATFVEERELICGNAASFQGDERDVIILTMVDDNKSARNITAADYSKRYNVAVSRAKNQLWVVNSLDEALLAPDSLKFGLLEYSKHYAEHLAATVNRRATRASEMETEVADFLAQRGYQLDRQYVVGSFQLDLVVRYGHLAVALECDPEREAKAPAAVLSDLERQMVLERQGWSFLPLRGGVYYADKAGTLERLVQQLAALGIEPESVADGATQEAAPIDAPVDAETAPIIEAENAGETSATAEGGMETVAPVLAEGDESSAPAVDTRIPLVDRVRSRAAALLALWQAESEEQARLAAEAEARKPKTMREAAQRVQEGLAQSLTDKDPTAALEAATNAGELAAETAQALQEQVVTEVVSRVRKSRSKKE